MSQALWKTYGLAIGNAAFTILAVVTEGLAILAASVASGSAYHLAVYGALGTIATYIAIGALTALFYTLPLYSRQIRHRRFPRRSPRHAAKLYRLDCRFLVSCADRLSHKDDGHILARRNDQLLFHRPRRSDRR